ncbi:two-component sensor histidine kinase [Bacillus sp. V3B]|uniref:PAS domain-containing sensor histidine kinase n=1 Tax=Bacillus sp. V3B TaxID=2804915 RepID=UPI00210A1B1A|nr:PAS domain-containing sensor histidine kinase [Bacillus sp. V3B]MCQ6275071.1 two-component sensor histidine kinase [Bacillus sp. V3B]
MKNFKHYIYLYIMIVILPAIIIVSYFSSEISKQDTVERARRAEWIASFHEDHWDNLIGNSVTIIETLSMTAVTIQDTLEKMEPILLKANESDHRYGGMYLLDTSGNVLTGTGVINETHFSKQKYIQEVIHMKDIIISNEIETLINGQRVIGLARPVLDEEQNFLFIIIAYLNVDYIQNILKMMMPEEHIVITNANDEMIMQINHSEKIKEQENYYSLPINRIPWKIHVSLREANQHQLRWEQVKIGILTLFLCHIIYLLVHYYRLRRQSAREKKQNEVQKLELVGTFAASIAHEIRNPLTGIKGLVQLLNEKYTSEKDQTYFSVIDQEINRINEIVSEFLVLGKPTAVKIDTVDVRMVLTELIPLIQYEADRNHHQSEFILPKHPMYVLCSKDQMKQVILNITKNAIESMNSKGNLIVELKQVSNECHLSISDTGIGISPKEKKKIFKSFYTSKETGTGLGLVICKRIIDSFGGHIHISSKVNKGTTFTISLPVSTPSQ